MERQIFPIDLREQLFSYHVINSISRLIETTNINIEVCALNCMLVKL